MKMTFRWYGAGFDPIPLQYIKQIPGVTGIMGTLSYKQAGENWEKEEIKELIDAVHAAGLECEIIESVNVHEDIKLGLDTRDEYIENYKTTLENLAEFGVKVVVYNFMPVFDWLRTDLFHEDPRDGSTSLYYDHDKIQGMTPQDIVNNTEEDSGGLTLPGWEPERLARLDEVMALYQGMTGDKLRENWKYFLEAIMPTCERVGIKMACHPDDPAWDLFGIPRVYKNMDDIVKILDLHESKNHGLCVHRLARIGDDERSASNPALRGRPRTPARRAHAQRQALLRSHLQGSGAPLARRRQPDGRVHGSALRRRKGKLRRQASPSTFMFAPITAA